MRYAQSSCSSAKLTLFPLNREMNELSFKEQLKIWLYVAAHSFGGPAGQMAVIHKKVVEEKKFVSEEKFLHALNFCMLLPGPEAQQLATYLGWMMGKWRGGLLAGGLFILPGFLSILSLSCLYVLYQEATLVQGLFYGMKPAIIAIVISALWKIARKSLTGSIHWTLAGMAFISLFFLNISFPVVVVTSALVGLWYGKLFDKSISVQEKNLIAPKLQDTLQTVLIWGSVWLLPIIGVVLVFGADSTFHELNLFFSKMSMVTFGGAYAALSYVAQKAVEVHGWLQGSEMLDGLAMAETTPGPLIQTVQFVGFMAAYRFPNGLEPLIAATIGSILVTWMTFAPCFLWIFTFAPYVEYLRSRKSLSHALKAISAAVVGVILNLSIWFILKTLFSETRAINYFPVDFDLPVISSLDPYALLIGVVSVIMIFAMKQSIHFTLALSVLLGILFKYVVVV